VQANGTHNAFEGPKRVDRRIELDWLRGLMLVLMTFTHLPTWFGAHLGQPFGLVSAAEGFVFVSAFLVGCVYGRVARVQGEAAMRQRILHRTLVIYAAQVATLFFLLYVVLPLAVARDAAAVTDLASFRLAHPQEALLGGLALAYSPPLLDILPMYVLFMAASPWLLGCARRNGFPAIVVPSVGLWLLAQLGAGPALHDVLATLGLAVPYRETGAFSWLAWQLLWVLGMWAGAAAQRGTAWQPSRGVVALAAAVALAGLALRYTAGQTPTVSGLPGAFDKWHLGPLRLLDFAALLVLVVAATPVIRRIAHRSPLTTLGRAALTVFVAHLAICLVALAMLPELAPAQPAWQDALLLGVTLAALLCVARLRLVLGPRVATAVAALGLRGRPSAAAAAGLSASPQRTAR
jgi:hypothetical protein